MQEIWKDIKFTDTDGKEYDYTGLYQLSNMGRIRSMNYRRSGKAKVLQVADNGSGYLYIGLHKNRKVKNFLIHRLVATIFIENDDPINKTEVNHISEDKLNCKAENLEWVTPKQNANHGTRNKRAGEKHRRQVICIETMELFESIIDAERKTNSQHIGDCCKGKIKTSGGYHWMYYSDYLKLNNENSDTNAEDAN